jgi:hypothetical protein
MISDLDRVKRQQIVNQVLNATTLTEIEAALQALDAWMALYPLQISAWKMATSSWRSCATRSCRWSEISLGKAQHMTLLDMRL